MKSKFTHEEKQAILDRYISKSESPTSIIKSVGICDLEKPHKIRIYKENTIVIRT